MPSFLNKHTIKFIKTNIFYLYAILIIVFIFIFYNIDRDKYLYISDINNDNWNAGVSIHDGRTFLLKQNPYAQGLKVGSRIKFDQGETFHVDDIALIANPFWAVGDDKTAVLIGNSSPIWEIKLNHVIAIKNVKRFEIIDVISPDIAFFANMVVILTIASIVTCVFYSAMSCFDTFRGLRKYPFILFGISYFVGISYLLFIWRLSSRIMDSAFFGFFSAVVGLVIIVIILNRRLFSCFRRGKINYPLSFFLFLSMILSTFLIFYWVSTQPYSLSNDLVRSTIGTNSSGRYANISYFIYKNNFIPTLLQNYGHSILATVTFWLGLESPRLALLIWLSVSMSALVLTVMGFVAWMGGSLRWQMLVAFVILFGSPRLTFLTIVLADNRGTPVIYNSFADTVLGMGAMLAATILALSTTGGSRYQPKGAVIAGIMFFLLGSLWAIVGFQFFVSFLLICAVIIFGNLKRCAAWKFVSVMAVAAMLGFVISLPFGGMLTPEALFPKTSHYIAGVQSAPRITLDDVWLRFHSRYGWIKDPSDWTFGERSGLFAPYFKNMQWHSVADFYNNFFSIETVFFDVIRSWFFIIVGIYGAYRMRLSIGDKVSGVLNYLILFSIVTNIMGFLISTVFTIRGVIWELSRFTNSGYFIGMLLFAIVAWKIIQHKKGVSQAAMIMCICVCAIGPAVSVILQLYGSYRLSFAQKVNAITSLPPQTFESELRDSFRR